MAPGAFANISSEQVNLHERYIYTYHLYIVYFYISISLSIYLFIIYRPVSLLAPDTTATTTTPDQLDFSHIQPPIQRVRSGIMIRRKYSEETGRSTYCHIIQTCLHIYGSRTPWAKAAWTGFFDLVFFSGSWKKSLARRPRWMNNMKNMVLQHFWKEPKGRARIINYFWPYPVHLSVRL